MALGIDVDKIVLALATLEGKESFITHPLPTAKPLADFDTAVRADVAFARQVHEMNITRWRRAAELIAEALEGD